MRFLHPVRPCEPLGSARGSELPAGNRVPIVE